MNVNHWFKRGVPARWARAIETATNGAVKRHELRPDLFDPPAETARTAEEVAP